MKLKLNHFFNARIIKKYYNNELSAKKLSFKVFNETSVH